MNMVRCKLKIREEYGWYRGGHKRYQMKMNIGNMSKEQKDKLERAVRKAVEDILPEKKDTEMKGL